MARCKRCGAHTNEIKHYETEATIVIDFLPTERGDIIITELGYGGELTPEERQQLKPAGVLFFTRHDCRETLEQSV